MYRYNTHIKRRGRTESFLMINEHHTHPTQTGHEHAHAHTHTHTTDPHASLLAVCTIPPRGGSKARQNNHTTSVTTTNNRTTHDVPNIGLHVWLITSRQTEPDISSTFGWNMRFSNPIEGDLKGYSFGSVTCTFQIPPVYGAASAYHHHGGTGKTGGGTGQEVPRIRHLADDGQSWVSINKQK